MLKKLLTLTVIPLILAQAVGCGGDERIGELEFLEYAPLAPHEPLAPQEPPPSDETMVVNPRAAVPEQKAGKAVIIEAKFLLGPSRLMRRLLPLKPSEPLATARRARVGSVLEQLRAHRDFRVLAAPRLTLYSGKAASVSVAREMAFVRDWACEPNEEGSSWTFQPLVDRLATGTTLNLAARAEKDTAVLTRLAPTVRRLLAWRHCTATVGQAGKRRRIEWQEAVVMESVPAVKDPCEIRLDPEDVLVVPIRFRVHQTAANARAYALAGRVRERPVPGQAALTTPAAANLQEVMLLRAWIVAASGI